jgi:hypothetical protein
MVWAVLVALGVAVVSMTLFGARLTRRPQLEDSIVEDLDADVDPHDPWAAWKPRPFEEIDRPRPRVWPVLAAFTGLIMVGAGFAGARQTLWATPSASAIQVATPRPYTVEVELPPTPTVKPTPKPTVAPATPAPPAPTAAPATAAPQPAATAAPASAATGSAPTITGSASCSGGTITLNYTATGTELSWIAVWVDGKSVKGGPISGSSHSSSYSGAATPGDHDLEVSVEDKAGRTSRKVFYARCA